MDRFRINVFRRAIDQIITSIDNRFLVNLPLVKDTSCHDPRHFDELRKNGIPRQSLEQVGKLTGLNPTDLRSELVAFVNDFPFLSKTLQEKLSEEPTDFESLTEAGADEDTEVDKGNQCSEIGNTCSGPCRKCLKCCYKALYKYSLNSVAYTNLFLA